MQSWFASEIKVMYLSSVETITSYSYLKYSIVIWELRTLHSGRFARRISARRKTISRKVPHLHLVFQPQFIIEPVIQIPQSKVENLSHCMRQGVNYVKDANCISLKICRWVLNLDKYCYFEDLFASWSDIAVFRSNRTANYWRITH